MIYIVTPVFNRKKFTKKYLEALGKQTVKDFKVIIVDDGSTDGTSKMIESEFPDVVLLKEEGNLWWAEATNIGVRYAMEHNATYVMTLNDDTLPESDYIEKMVYWSKKEPEALLGALAIDVNTEKEIFGGQMRNWKNGKDINILDSLNEEEMHGLHKVNFFPGRGLLIPIKVFKEVGLYDSKHFPQTVSDLDFTFRSSNAGFKIYCNYDSKIKIYPDESATIKLRNNKSFKKYIEHLFGRRGGGNLKFFTIFVFKNAPKRYLIPFLINGLARRILGYWIK
jgi:GT2 family glycosyltransferase